MQPSKVTKSCPKQESDVWHFWLIKRGKLVENWEYEAQNSQLSRGSKFDKILTFCENNFLKIRWFDNIFLFQTKTLFFYHGLPGGKLETWLWKSHYCRIIWAHWQADFDIWKTRTDIIMLLPPNKGFSTLLLKSIRIFWKYNTIFW